MQPRTQAHFIDVVKWAWVRGWGILGSNKIKNTGLVSWAN